MTPRQLLLLYLKQHRTDPHAPEKWHAAIVALFDEQGADAKRYQDIRAKTKGPLPMVRVQVMRRGQYVLCEGTALDAAIDAARAAGETTG